MPRVRQSAAERTVVTYRSLCKVKAEERGYDAETIGEIFGCSEKTARKKIAEVETQTFSEMLRAAEKMGIGILIFDKENYEPLLKPKG